ncbi:hypothetical protein PT974_11453 [Cladobotryum mycophilum]|uniref:2EXR domain-containing protein n=1 Tax=Cladobotryum mycophilum TaxID=491253 RepID=A0ABR0S5B4_9HYPO
MSFTYFPLLPFDIREAIWKYTLPDDQENVAGVCLLENPDRLDYHLNGYANGLPEDTFLVDIDYPVAMHVCRESRQFVLNTQRSGVGFRGSKSVDCWIPCRPCRPREDIIFVPHEAVQSIFDTAFNHLEVKMWLNQWANLAVECETGLSGGTLLLRSILSLLPNLRTLTIVLPDSKTEGNVTNQPFDAPTGRCRLNWLSDDDLNRIVLTGSTYRRRGRRRLEVVQHPLPLRQAIDCLCSQLNHTGWDYISRWRLPLQVEDNWPRCENCFPPVEDPRLFIGAFEEYDPVRRQWAELCGERRLPVPDVWTQRDRQVSLLRYFPPGRRVI